MNYLALCEIHNCPAPLPKWRDLKNLVRTIGTETLTRSFLTILSLSVLLSNLCFGQQESFTHQDSLRGGNNPEKDWWDLLKYDITLKPEMPNKQIHGMVSIRFKTIMANKLSLQIDLQDSLVIDSAFIESNRPLSTKEKNPVIDAVSFSKEGNAWHLFLRKGMRKNAVATLRIYYHGSPKQAVHPPWDGGWVWSKDDLGRPWLSTACQGTGASTWFPCKDVQWDEPDLGASLTVIAPEELTVVSNGTLQSKRTDSNHQTTTTWTTKAPINNYCIVPYIGHYQHYEDTLHGEAGIVKMSFWPLDYHLDKAKAQFPQAKEAIRCFEHWFGPYPFREDGYKLVEAPYIGMEHQSAVAYGNGFKNGYHGTDLSKTGIGMKWDFIIVHETGHEWFGNNITAKDIADMWVHEAFTDYSETLYTEWLFGKKAADEYNQGLRKLILNDKPIIGPYGVNKEGSGDMYYKGANLLHTIRHIVANDSLFRSALRGLNNTFYHKTVEGKNIEDAFAKMLGLDLSKVFDQYLRTVKVPTLVYKKKNNEPNQVTLHWENTVDGFDMPILIPTSNRRIRVSTQPTSFDLNAAEAEWMNKENLENRYYILAINLSSQK